MQFNNSESAIVLVEFQEQWTEKGLFHWMVKRQLKSRDAIKNTQKLIVESRKRGVSIIHAPLVVDPRNKKGWMAYATFGWIFTKNNWKSEIAPGLFEEGDPIAKREYYNLQAFDAFYKSDLEKILREQAVKNIFICGFATDQCPSKTLRTAERKGFNPFLVSDCTATFSGLLQKRAEQKHGERTLSSQDVLEGLR